MKQLNPKVYIWIGASVAIVALAIFIFLTVFKHTEPASTTPVEWKIEKSVISDPDTNIQDATTSPETDTQFTLPEQSTTSIKETNTKPSVVKNIATTTVVASAPKASTFNISAMLQAHNVVRTKHNLPQLTWSNTIAESAQKWSNQLKSENCEFRHDLDTPYGENIYWAWESVVADNKLISKPEDAAVWWANEEAFYNYDKNTCKAGEQCGHYTQMAWKTTTEVGCGVSTCISAVGQSDVWVCRYNPAGNDGTKPY